MADRKVTTRLDANVSGFVRGMAEAKAATAALNRELNTSNDRTSWLVGSLLGLAPAAVPIGATVVPAFMALTTQVGLAAAAGGTMALAFVGVGDALSALNKAQLDPTKENLEALSLAMNKLGPDGENFVKFLDSVGPQFNELRLAARAGMFPGIEEGITAFMERLPDLKRVVTEISETIGQLANDAGQGLGGPEFDAFFEFLKSDAGPILLATGQALGNFIDGFASMTVAFGPTTADFSEGLLNMSQRFEEWAEQLRTSQDFQEFIAYVQDVTPDVLAFFGQLADTFVDLAVAAAPVGKVMLPILTGVLNILGEIARTPTGSILIAVTAVSALAGRMLALQTLASSGVIGSLMTGQFLAMGKAADGASKKVTAAGNAAVIANSKWRTAGTVGLFALGTGLSMVETESDKANQAFGVLAGAATGAAIGTAILPGWGTAIGAVGGGVISIVSSLDDAEEATTRAKAAAEEWQAVFPTQEFLDEQLGLLAGDDIPKGVRPIAEKEIKVKQPEKRTVTTEYKTLGVQASVAQATRVAQAAKMTPKEVKTWLRTLNWDPKKINAVVRSLERAETLANIRSHLTLTGWSAKKIETAVKALEDADSKSQVRATLETKGFDPADIETVVALFDQVGKKPPNIKVKSNAKAEARAAQAAMNSVKNVSRTITITRRTVTKPAGGGALIGGTLHSFADGGFPWDSGAPRARGAIRGPGTGTSDSIPAMISNGEHVLTADDVKKAGGQDAIFRLRAGIQAGELNFARGGGFGGSVGGSSPSGARPLAISGELSIRDGRAYIEGIAYETASDLSAAKSRMDRQASSRRGGSR